VIQKIDRVDFLIDVFKNYEFAKDDVTFNADVNKQRFNNMS